MADNRDFFTPEQVEEQVAWLRQHPPAHQESQRYPGESQLIEDLQRLYQSEQAAARSLDQVWSRLESQGVSAPGPSQTPPHAPPPQPSRPPSQASTPAVPARRGLSTRFLAIAAAVLFVVVVSGLVGGLVLSQHGPRVSNQPTVKPGQTAAPGQTATSVPTSCATRPTATAEAWFPNPKPNPSGPGSIRGQITGTINNGPITTLSDFHYPLGIPPESQSYATSPFFMAWSPDAHYLAVGVNAPYTPPVYTYVVDTTTHEVTPISIPNQDTGDPWPGWVGGRLFAWADTHTLLLFYGGNTAAQGSAGPTLSYDVLTKTLTPLPQIRAVEGIVRCSTLFYLELTVSNNQSSNVVGDALLHRYNLETHSEIGQPIHLSATYANPVNPASHLAPDTTVPLWDVSPDGTRLVYEQEEEATPDGYLTKQQFLVANSDGTNAMPLFTPPQRPDIPSSFAKIAPNGQFVVISGLLIASISMSGGPVRLYGNSTAGNYGGYPTWLPDSSGFDVVNTVPTQQSFSLPFISRYLLNTSPGSNGYVPGTTQVPDAQTLAGLP